MKTSEIMTLGVAAVAPDATVAQAAQLMIDHRVSGLPVITQDGKLVGMVTERDLIRREESGTEVKRPRWLEILLGPAQLADEYVHAHARKVEDVMTRNVITVTPDTPVSEVVELLENRDIKRLPVVRNGKVAGIVSRANLLRTVARGGAPAKETEAASDDRVIRRQILDALAAENWSQGLSLDIVVRDGVVELNGTAPEEHIRDAARVAAENVPGVKEVRDRIEIKPPVIAWN